MKTPLQEHIEALKILRDTALEKEKLYEDLVLTEHYEGRAKAFEDAIAHAESMLEKEKEVMCEFADDYQRNCFQKSADDCFEETFNTK